MRIIAPLSFVLSFFLVLTGALFFSSFARADALIEMSAQAVSSTEVDLSWNAGPSGSSYMLVRSNVADDSTNYWYLPDDSMNYQDTSVDPDSAYYYTLYRGGDDQAHSAPVWADTSNHSVQFPSGAPTSSSGPNLVGFGWATTTGWIGFGQNDASRVNLIPGTSGNSWSLQGYAWSSNLGWLHFDPSLSGPTSAGSANAAAHGVAITADNKVYGWAQLCSVFASGCSGTMLDDTQRGGFDGWVSFGQPNDAKYGLVFDPAALTSSSIFAFPNPAPYRNLAWGYLNASQIGLDDVRIEGGSTTTPTTATFSCSPDNSAPQTNQDVHWTITPSDAGVYAYVWTFTLGDGVSPASMSSGYPKGSGAMMTARYTATGGEAASVAVTGTDADNNPVKTTVVCQASVTNPPPPGGDCGAAVCVNNKTPVNGICGSANNTTVATVPSANLCLAGTASAVSGTGPWAWTCAGLNGGTTASCSAQSSLIPSPNPNLNFTFKVTTPNDAGIGYTNPTGYPVGIGACTNINTSAAGLSMTNVSNPALIDHVTLTLPNANQVFAALIPGTQCYDSKDTPVACTPVLSAVLYKTLNNKTTTTVISGTTPLTLQLSDFTSSKLNLTLCLNQRGRQATNGNSPYDGRWPISLTATVFDNANNSLSQSVSFPFSIEDNIRSTTVAH